MRFFLDTEFSERGPMFPVKLISIGIVAEDDREFYAVAEYNENECNNWVIANVLPYLGDYQKQELGEIGKQVREFVGESKPEFWGYYADYDWVVFCQIFGSMIDLPKNWPMYCRDLKQWCDKLGNPKLPKKATTEHNALSDAKWNQQIYDFLKILDSNI